MAVKPLLVLAKHTVFFFSFVKRVINSSFLVGDLKRFLFTGGRGLRGREVERRCKSKRAKLWAYT